MSLAVSAVLFVSTTSVLIVEELVDRNWRSDPSFGLIDNDAVAFFISGHAN